MAKTTKRVAVKRPAAPPQKRDLPKAADASVEIKSVVRTNNTASRNSRDPNPAAMTSELANIDFRKMLGGPLQAAVDAQVASSLASIDFINNVGFKTVGTGANAKKELVYVDFTHEQIEIVPPPEGSTAAATEKKTTKYIKVPLLTMVQVPSLRIEYVDISFKAKLNSVESKEVTDKLGITVDAKGGWGPISFKVSASYQRQSTSGVKVEKEYALDIKMKAVQDEIPRGLEEILGMLK
ncbi:MAG: DUF2589 domain-containing protein [Saprospiraceae bacterium]|nr:DUF2589 domain-containing protein [Saprospiraceae bacterium]MBK8849040.1 DUF2589 domain-containing protein [Saprospiraceae bacterium]